MLKFKNYIFLIVTFFVYSLSLLFSKFASIQLDSFYFLFFYGISVLIMVLYAILWQMVLKNMSLSVAFPFKAITLIFSLMFGYLIFNEVITIKKIIAIIIIIIGIILVGNEYE